MILNVDALIALLKLMILDLIVALYLYPNFALNAHVKKMFELKGLIWEVIYGGPHGLEPGQNV